MIDRTQEIKRFLKRHYSPYIEGGVGSVVYVTTGKLLSHLFTIFPIGCIDTYELFEILTQLGHEPQKIGPIDFAWFLVEEKVKK